MPEMCGSDIELGNWWILQWPHSDRLQMITVWLVRGLTPKWVYLNHHDLPRLNRQWFCLRLSDGFGCFSGLLKAPHCLDCCCHPHETVAGAHVVQGGSLTIAYVLSHLRPGPAIQPLKGCVES